MANYLGSTYKPATPRTDENFALMVQVAQMKQSVYDTKKAQIQQTLDAFGNIDVLRDQDKEYIAAKLGSIRNDINSYGNRDLSQPGVGDELMSKIKVAAQDPFIQGAMEDAYKFRNFQQEVAQKQAKNDGSYNDVNYAYALNNSGYDEYMRGDKKRLGNLQYTNYSNYDKKINDFVIDLQNKKKDQTIQVQELDSNGNPTGAIIEQKISGLSPQQLRSVASTMLTPEDQKQIEIDGWYNNGGYDNPNIITNVKSVLNSDISQKDSRMKSIQIKLNAGGLSPEEKAMYETELTSLGAQKSSVEKNLGILSTDPRAAATYLEQQKVIDNVVTRFAGLYTESQKKVKDDVYWAQKNYDLSLEKHRYTIQKDALKAQEDASGQNLTVLSQGLPDTPEKITSYEKAVDDVIAQTSQDLDNTTMRYKSLIEAEAQKGNKDAQSILDIYLEKVKSKGTEQTDADVFRSVVTENIGSNNALSLLGGENNVLKMKQGIDKLSLYIKGKAEAERRAKEEHVDKTLNSQEVFTAFHKNTKTAMLWNGVATPVHQVLKEAGLMDSQGNKTGDIKNNPEILQALQRSYYADATLNKLNLRTYTKEKVNIEALRDLAQSFGEDVGTIVKSEFKGYDKYGGAKYANEINESTKTGQYLINAKKEGIYDKNKFLDMTPYGMFNADQSLSGDDADIAKFIKSSWKDSEIYKQDLAQYRDKLPNSQMLAVSPKDTQIFDGLLTMAQGYDDTFNPSKNRAITIRKAGEYLEISQSGVEGTGDKKQTIAQPVQVTWQDFQRNLPELANRIEFDSQSAIYTYDKLQNEPLISEPIKYVQDKSDEIFEYNAEVLLREQPQLRGFLTATDSKSTMKRNNAVLVQKYPEVGQIIDRAVDSSSNYSVNINMTAKYGTPKLHMKLVDKMTGEAVHTISQVGYTDADNFKDILDSAPQVYYSMLVNDILQRQLSDAILGSTNESYEKLKKSLKIQ